MYFSFASQSVTAAAGNYANPACRLSPRPIDAIPTYRLLSAIAGET